MNSGLISKIQEWLVLNKKANLRSIAILINF